MSIYHIRPKFRIYLLALTLVACLVRPSWAAPPRYQPGLPQFDHPAPILKPEKVEVLGKYFNQCKSLTVSENGKWAVTCSFGGVLQAWDAKAKRELPKLSKQLEGKEFAVAVSNDGHALMGGESQAVDVWNLQTGKIVFTHETPEATVTHVAISDDDKWMIAADAEGAIFRYPLLGGKGNTLKLPVAIEKPYNCFSIAADGNAVTVGYDQGAVIVFRFPEPGVSLTEKNFQAHVFGGPSPLFADVEYAAMGPEGEKIFLAGWRRWLKTLHFGKNGAARFQGTTTNSLNIDSLEFLSDANLVAALDHRWMELRSPDSPTAHAWIDWRPLRSSASDINRAGTLVGIASQRKAYLVHLPELPQPPRARFESEVITALREGNYEKLEGFGKALAQDNSPGFAWSQGTSKYTTLLVFLGNDSFYEDKPGAALKRLESWRDKYPQAILPRLALAQEYSSLAWEARGSGFAGQVTEKGWREFARYLKKMEAELKGIQPDDKTPPDYFRLVLTLAKDAGWEREQADAVAELVKKHAPNYAPAHAAMADYLMPRWHGNPGDSERYARTVADEIGGGEGAAVYAQVAISLARYCTPEISNRDFLVQHLKFDLDRVWDGLTHLYKESNDATWLVKELVYVAWLREDRQSAKRFVERLYELTLAPGWTKDETKSFKDIENWASSK